MIFLTGFLYGQDTSEQESKLTYRGQLSSWSHFNRNNAYPLLIGSRYIPQLNYEEELDEGRKIDFEASANFVGDLRFRSFDSLKLSGDVNPYRIWGRYSTKQMEIRLGLQKIDFGASTMLRSLRWFDQVDPRDPLQITNGVYAALFRYYFLNNVNIWVWGLYGNENLKGMEFIKSNRRIPELGGRVQFPLKIGEIGLSYHHRTADSRENEIFLPQIEDIQENRVGFDAKLDLAVGFWVESVYSETEPVLGNFNTQWLNTIGVDYTIGLGNGLNVTLEHLNFGNGANLSEIQTSGNFTALAARYPIGMFDNLVAISYYDWVNSNSYNFINWMKQYNAVDFYLMAYWNPESSILPTGNGAQNIFGGRGIQLMLVYNH